MPLGISTTFSDEDMAAMEALRDPNEEPLPGDDDGAPAANTAPQETQPKAEGQPATDDTKPAEAAAPADQPKEAEAEKPKGNRNQALRAARIGEQRERQRRETAEAEVAELRKQLEAKASKPADASPDLEDMTDEEIEELAIDMPVAAKAARMAKAAKVALEKFAAAQAAAPAAQPQAQADPDFVPEVLPPALQAVVDENEELLGWQHDPDQTRFTLAKAADGLLINHPKWKDVSPEKRLAEVVRRVNAELASDPAEPKAGLNQPTAQQRLDPKTVIANAPARTPKAISEIGGGSGSNDQGPDVARFRSMSADDVEAELMTRG